MRTAIEQKNLHYPADAARKREIEQRNLLNPADAARTRGIEQKNLLYLADAARTSNRVVWLTLLVHQQAQDR